MTAKLRGRVDWSLSKDKDSNRTYTVKWLVETSDPRNDGPLTVLNCPYLPAIGASWAYGNDSDTWARCSPEVKVTPKENTQEPQALWFVEQTFTTKPIRRCQSEQITDPLLEPMGISGSFVKYTRERNADRYGKPLVTSAGELMKGPSLEVDESRPTVSISMNTAANQLANFSPYMDFVSDGVLWGLPKRCVKLSGGNWQRKLYGVCSFYYTTTLDFEVNYKTFDRKVYDHGRYAIKVECYKTKEGNLKILTNDAKDALVRNGQVGPYKNMDGDMADVFLDGHGMPFHLTNPGVNDTPPYRLCEFYEEANFLLLGIPSSL